MSNRFYICPLREFSTDPSDPEDTSWRATVTRYLIGHPGVCNVAAHSSHGPNAWALVKMNFVDAADHARVVADPEVDAMPGVETSHMLSTQERRAVQDIFTKRSVPGLVNAPGTLKEMLGRIARRADPMFVQDDWLDIPIVFA